VLDVGATESVTGLRVVEIGRVGFDLSVASQSTVQRSAEHRRAAQMSTLASIALSAESSFLMRQQSLRLRRDGSYEDEIHVKKRG
jgi:hypothetical protein